MSGRRRLSCIAVALCIVATFAAAKAPPAGGEAKAPKRIEYGKGRTLAMLADTAINESSGLACGRTNKGVFWTHNDSGDKARVFAFNAKGQALATITLAGAGARDWEDMASVSLGRTNFLLVGDIGDNNARRKFCTLYAIVEPRLNTARRRQVARIPVAQTIHFRYEDGPHNCESLAVDPTTRTIYLVSKITGLRCKVYALKWPKRPTREPLVAKAVASLTIPVATAMDISPDGLRAVVLTYGPAFEYVRRPDETWAQGFARGSRLISVPSRRQGESICYGPDGKTLYLTTECAGKNARTNPSPLLEVPAKKPADEAKTAAPPRREQ